MSQETEVDSISLEMMDCDNVDVDVEDKESNKNKETFKLVKANQTLIQSIRNIMYWIDSFDKKNVIYQNLQQRYLLDELINIQCVLALYPERRDQYKDRLEFFKGRKCIN